MVSLIKLDKLLYNVVFSTCLKFSIIAPVFASPPCPSPSTEVNIRKTATGGPSGFAASKGRIGLYGGDMPWVKLHPPGPSASLIELESHISGWVQIDEAKLLVEGPTRAPVMKALLPMIPKEPGMWWVLFEVQEYSVVDPNKEVIAHVGGA